jgi:hypothetical protein
MKDRRTFIAHSILGIAAAATNSRVYDANSVEERLVGYICPPCASCPMDDRVFDAPGRCPGCGMTLIPRPGSLQQTNLARSGTGAFTMPGGLGHERDLITVNYHRPSNFRADSRILIVLPGSGRDGDEYRDAWIETANSKGVFVAALTYPERAYDFAAYQLGGVVRNLEIRNMPVGSDGSTPSVVRLRDEDLRFEINTNKESWLFHDFDRVFESIKRATGSTMNHYDIFGHSAGAQILHRHVLFHPNSRADRIVAANAGFYTLPDLQTPQILGLKGTGVTAKSLQQSFASKLTLLLGELDNSGEEGGINLHTPLIDKQGIGRLDRGRYFYRTSEAIAKRAGAPFMWRLQTVPGVGHDFRKMSKSAATVLYP